MARASSAFGKTSSVQPYGASRACTSASAAGSSETAIPGGIEAPGGRSCAPSGAGAAAPAAGCAAGAGTASAAPCVAISFALSAVTFPLQCGQAKVTGLSGSFDSSTAVTLLQWGQGTLSCIRSLHHLLHLLGLRVFLRRVV